MTEFLELKDVQKILGLSRNKIYEMVKLKEFPVIRIGKKYKVPKQMFNDWLNSKKI